MSAEFRLYSRWQNSAGERVRIALNLKRLEYKYVPVNSLPPGKYTRLNPQGLLPALEVDGQIIPQSAAILDYLEERFPTPPLLPDDPIRRAQARAFAAAISSELHPLTVKRVRHYLKDKATLSDNDVSLWIAHWHQTALNGIERTLEDRDTHTKFCFSDTPGWADLHLVPQLANARRFEIDLNNYPLAREIDAHCSELDTFKRARPEQQPDYPTPP